jgi:uncharacterized protein YhaN/VIT1/CCC1 family predicted Fe2+/Mn2+ transporter
LRIKRLYIENFGHFNGRVIDPVDDALTVVHGPNEAGKSALRAFIRSTLFGYLDRRNRQYEFYNYPPVNGGKASGALDIVTGTDGSRAAYTVSREQGRNGGSVIVSGDATGGTELLERLLDRIGPELYQNLFSISLNELQELSTLNSPEIRDRIYSVGLGLSRVSLPDAMSQIDRDTRALRGPKSGSIRKADKELHEARAELEEARKEHAAYADVASRLSETEEQVIAQQDRLEAARTQREQQNLTISLRPHGERITGLQEQLLQLPQFPDFPANAERQMDGYILQLNNLKDQMESGDAKQDERTEEIQKVDVVEPFEDRAIEIRRLIAETEHYRKAVEDLPGVQTSQRIEEDKFQRDLELLGSGWDYEAIEKFDAQVDFLADLETAGSQLTETHTAYQDAEAEVVRRTDNRDAISGEVSRAAAIRDSVEGVPEQTSDELGKRQERLGRLRGALAERYGIKGDLSDAEMKLVESLGEADTTIIGGFLGSIWIAVTLVVLSLSVIGFAVWDKELAPAIPGLGGLAAGIVMMIRARTSGQGFAIKVTRPMIDEARTILAEQRDELEARLEELTKEIGEIAGEFGMPKDPSIRDIEEQAAATDRAVHRRVLFETRGAATAESQGRLKEAETRLQEVSDTRTLTYNNYAITYARWQEVLKTAGLRDDLKPGQANSVMERLRSLKSQLGILASYRERVAQMIGTIEDIESRLTEQLELAGMAPTEHMQAGPALTALSERFRSHELAVQRREALIKELNGWIAQRDIDERRIGQVEGNINELMRYAGTEEEQEFVDIARKMVQRWSIEAKIAELIEAHPLLDNEEGAEHREQLEANSLGELKARLGRIDDEVREIELGLGEMQRERGDLERQRKQLESSSKVAELRARINVLEDRINTGANRWAVLRIAGHLLETTRETFQRERQPSLIQSAGKYFEKLTLGRYTRVEAVLGEQDLVVYEVDGTRKGVSGLSRGTAEQLYLSMRFALIEEYSRNAEPMPVIMDDVLVNFDPERAQAAADVIAEMSSSFQVLMLTCHPQTVTYFKIACSAQGRREARPMRSVDLQEGTAEPGQLTLVG